MLFFEPYSLEALKKVRNYLQNSPYLCSDFSMGFLFMWQEGSNVQFCVWNDTFVVRRDIGEQASFSWPYGADPDGMVDELLAYTRENNLPLRFFSVDEETLAVIRNDPRLSPAMAAADSRWSDYVYCFEDAATFHGKKFSGQRNHINKFHRLYGDPDVRFLRPEDHPRLFEMLREYEAEHSGGSAMERIEEVHVRQVIDKYEELGLHAACMFVGGELAAFSIGEIVGEMLIIHVEKALTRYEGIYPTMYQSFVRLVGESTGKEIRYINREDDSGDPGLRTSKQQYHPIRMIDKYMVHANAPAARVQPMPVIPAGDVVLTAMREDDREAYMRMNLDVENNRWWGYDYREDAGITGPIDENTFYDSAQYDMRMGDSINFAVRETEDGPMIGEGILWKFTAGGQVEAGLRLMPEYHGRGYGKSAYIALADFAERELELKVVARCFLPNQPSYHMITGSGFRVVRQDEKYYYFERQK